jgi:hypothetical protein
MKAEAVLKAKRTKKSVTAKKATKEGVKERRAKDTRKKANEEAMLEQRSKEEALKNEALNLSYAIRQHGYCQVGITSSPPALMTLCIAAAEACHEENDGTELLGR